MDDTALVPFLHLADAANLGKTENAPETDCFQTCHSPSYYKNPASKQIPNIKLFYTSLSTG
jgi:hypothetical protein